MEDCKDQLFATEAKKFAFSHINALKDFPSSCSCFTDISNLFLLSDQFVCVKY